MLTVQLIVYQLMLLRFILIPLHSYMHVWLQRVILYILDFGNIKFSSSSQLPACTVLSTLTELLCSSLYTGSLEHYILFWFTYGGGLKTILCMCIISNTLSEPDGPRKSILGILIDYYYCL